MEPCHTAALSTDPIGRLSRCELQGQQVEVASQAVGQTYGKYMGDFTKAI